MNRLLTIFAAVLLTLSANAQFQCGSGTPTFPVDLSNDPNAVWTSPDTNRIDTCCGATAPDKCVGFEVTLHPNAEGIIFEICDGAIPPGAIFYQVNCGSPTPVGQALCLTGVGPHYVTFCKPGNNSNIYCITSIAEPAPGPDISVNNGCSGYMYVDGYDPDSVTWTSVYPGPIGTYNNYLDCTSGCDSVNVQGQANAPDTVLYQVCGPLLGDCDSLHYCDTIAAYFFSTLEAVIQPEDPTVCFGAPGTWIYATGNGGSPPYSFLWGNGSTQDSIFVGVGTYYLEVGDTSGCPPAFDTVTVDSFSLPIEANAGNDSTYCITSTPIQLNGAVQAATGGRWLGGDGIFTPDSLTLNATYALGANDSINGFVNFMLITTGNGSCPADTDSLQISLHTFSSQVSFTATDVACNGELNGSIEVNSVTGDPISQYEWQTIPVSYGDSIGNLAAGTYSVLITDSLGCDSIAQITVAEPAVLSVSQLSLTNASCEGDNDGEIEVTATGGTPPYTYMWNNGDTASLIDSLLAGQYFVTLTDSNACIDTMSFIITEPPGINITLTGVNADCYGASSGAATVTATGPYINYSYNWSTGSVAPIIFNLNAGTYHVTVTYGPSCEAEDSITITQPDSLALSLTTVHISCYDLNDGSISTTLSGGSPPYSYAWSNGSNANALTGLQPNTYFLTVTDDNACQTTQSAIVIEPDSLDWAATVNDITCLGAVDGNILINAIGGTSPYSYSWNTGAIGNFISGLQAGSYSVIISDSNNCTKTAGIIISEPTELTGTLLAEDISCNTFNDGWISATPNGGTPGYSYNWSNGSISDSAVALTAGNHQVTITDANNCSIVLDTNLQQPDPITLQTSNNVTICLNTSTSISVTAAGGNGGYVYNWSDSLGNSDNHLVSPTETTTYSILVTDSLNCPPGIGSITVNVKPIVFSPINVSAQPEEICLGETAVITGAYGGSLQGYSVQWTPQIGGSIGSFNVSPDSTTSYIMRIIDDCGFSESDTVTLIVNPFPTIDFPELLGEGCQPLEVFFDPQISGITIAEYSWDFGNGQTSSLSNPSMTYQNAGTFNVSFSAVTDKGCEAQGNGSGMVKVFPSPVAEFEIDPKRGITTDNSTIKATDLSQDVISHDWTVSDGSSYDGTPMTHSFDDWGNYQVELMVRNVYGCTDKTSMPVYVEPVTLIEAPTAFTPNKDFKGDGTFDPSAMNNDIFYLITRYAEDFHLVIYNRWGETVFETFDPSKGWNGYYKQELAPMAMYVWRADVVFVDGKQVTQTGNVSLLR